MPGGWVGAHERTVRTLDGLVVFWVVLWLVVGLWSGYEIWQLSSLSRSTVKSGQALDGAGRAFQSLGNVPLVGDAPAQFGGRVRATAADIVASATEAGRSTRRLSVLLGLSITLIPVTPVLGLYVPGRLARRRDVRAIRKAVGSGSADPGLEAYLARRAVAHIPYPALRELSADPEGELANGRYRSLADAELSRLGISRLRAGAET